MKWSGLILLLIFLPVFLYAEDVTVLNCKDYLPSLISDINGAKSSIDACMYAAIYKPDKTNYPANAIFKDLVGAAARGVKVRLILDGRLAKNEKPLIEYLSGGGVVIRLSRLNHTVHSKLVLVDGRIVYVGSHNWTADALRHNTETSVRIETPQIAAQEEKDFAGYWGASR